MAISRLGMDRFIVSALFTVCLASVVNAETSGGSNDTLRCMYCTEYFDCLHRATNITCGGDQTVCSTYFQDSTQQRVVGKGCGAGLDRAHCGPHPARQNIWGCFCPTSFCNKACNAVSMAPILQILACFIVGGISRRILLLSG